MKWLFKINKLVYVFWISGFVIISCQKDLKKTEIIDPNTQVIVDPELDVYLAGYSKNESDVDVASYWKNGELTLVNDQSAQSYANDILVYNGSIYLAGVDNGKPCYWKDGARVYLNPNNQNLGEIISIAQNNNILYFAGTYRIIGTNFYRASIWMKEEGKVAKQIYLSNVQGEAINIEFIATGYLIVGKEDNRAVYWSNDPVDNSIKITLLSNTSGNAISVKVINNEYYMFGNTNTQLGNYWGLWKNQDTFTPLQLLSVENIINAISIDDNQNIFLVGHYWDNLIPKASYWTQTGEKVELSTVNSSATDILISEDDIYISGVSGYAACYWKNEKLISLATPNSYANSISIIKK